MVNKTMVWIYARALMLLVAMLVVGLWPAYSLADNDEGCTGNPHHCVGERGPPGADGADGADGVDGVDGEQGERGYTGDTGATGATGATGDRGATGAVGATGEQGIQGVQGIRGEVPTKWRTETINWYNEIRDVAAAQQAMQVYLPQDQKSRLTMSMSRVANTTGVGLGYAYMIDNERNSALTLSVGRAGSETAVAGSFGFEFGGTRKIVIPVFVPTPEPEPVSAEVTIPEEEYASLLMAQVQQEELEDLQRSSEDRYAEQQVLIEALQEEVKDDEIDQKELDRIKREAAAIRAAQEAEEKQQADVRAKFKRRLDAHKAKGDDEKEPNR
jgi:hypothetical protein